MAFIQELAAQIPVLAVDFYPMDCFFRPKDIDARAESRRVVLRQGKLMDKAQADDEASSCCCCCFKKAYQKPRAEENREAIEAFQRFLLHWHPIVSRLVLHLAEIDLADKARKGDALYADEVRQIIESADKMGKDKISLIHRVKQLHLQSAAEEPEPIAQSAAASFLSPPFSAPAAAAAAARAAAAPPSPLLSPPELNLAPLSPEKVRLFVREVIETGILLAPFDPKKISKYLTCVIELSRRPSEEELQEMIKNIQLSLIKIGKPLANNEEERVVDKNMVRKAIANELSRLHINFKFGNPPSQQVAEWLRSHDSINDIPPRILAEIYREMRSERLENISPHALADIYRDMSREKEKPSSEDHKESEPLAAPPPASAMAAAAAQPVGGSKAATPIAALETTNDETFDF